MTEKNIKIIHDLETDTWQEVELTDEELAFKKTAYEAELKKVAEEKLKLEARASALAKLAALGLSADEIAAL